MKDSITNVITGSAGIAAVNSADKIVEAVANTPVNDIVQTIISIIIGIVTLFGLFKKKPNKN